MVSNKRSRQEQAIMFETFQNDATLKEKKITMKRLDFDQYPTFKSQLELLGTVDVYLTGVGTGSMLHPFMAEGTFVINYIECRCQDGVGFPTARDAYLAGGTYYQRALYHDSASRCSQGIDKNQVRDLILKAHSLRGFKMPVPSKENVNAEAQLMYELFADVGHAETQRMLDIIDPINGYIEHCVYQVGSSFPGIDYNLVGKYKEKYKGKIMVSKERCPNFE
jgi:hypothetical protein